MEHQVTKNPNSGGKGTILSPKKKERHRIKRPPLLDEPVGGRLIRVLY